MAVVDICKLASSNTGNLEGLFKEIENKFSIPVAKGLLKKFIGFIRRSNVTINYKGDGALNFLEEGSMKSLRERYDLDKEELIKRSKKGYRGHRVKFEDIFIDGDKFIYGAANVSSVGLTKNWGPYTFIIDSTAVKTYERKIFLKYNSLRKKSSTTFYYFENNEPDLKKISEESSLVEHVDMLAVIKHENDIASVPINEWCDKLCQNKLHNPEYIEFITSNKIKLEHVSSVTYPIEESKKLNSGVINNLLAANSDDISELRWLNDIQDILASKSIKFQLI